MREGPNPRRPPIAARFSAASDADRDMLYTDRFGGQQGRREILVGPSEAETFWTAFLRKLARRGRTQRSIAMDARTRRYHEVYAR